MAVSIQDHHGLFASLCSAPVVHPVELSCVSFFSSMAVVLAQEVACTGLRTQ